MTWYDFMIFQYYPNYWFKDKTFKYCFNQD